jgi:glycosyltransferase involved in cell wall biosynthesis
MKLSIIIATRNRVHGITKCLDAVARSLARAPAIEAEVLVVDNASTDNTFAVVREWAMTCPFSVRPLLESKGGSSAARNKGIRESTGELLAFIDDDCRMSCNYVSDLLRHDATDIELVLRGGRVELGDANDLPITIKTDSQVLRWQRRLGSIRRGHIASIVVGANIAMRRGVIDCVGLFDEHLGPGTNVIQSGEDTDYFIRVYLANIAIEYVPDMCVYHFHGRKTPDIAKKLLRNYMIGNGALYLKYLLKNPDLCRPLWWDIKSAAREIRTGTNTFLPAIGFSHKDKVMWSLRGALRYLFNVKTEEGE